MDQILRNGESIILGDGLQTRDMIYVGDVIKSMIAVLVHDTPLKGEVLNVCTGKQVVVKEMHEMIAELMEKDIKFKSVPFLSGNVVHSLGSTLKAQQFLNWESQIPLKQGLALTYDWFTQNPDFYNEK
eukprot:TRINITY_DN3605_c0_g2_i1.p1 TRINITY_DN3605_c0_g2~~TRINITY_DN3605_c0_g2_i1.p1  ORF type:complete len:128 (-),score=21.75 TRINITY_DN3605_c0_g2_i1:115-498(-)